MADSADSDLRKVSSIEFRSEYCRFRKRITALNIGKIASFMVSLFSVLRVWIVVRKTQNHAMLDNHKQNKLDSLNSLVYADKKFQV